MKSEACIIHPSGIVLVSDYTKTDFKSGIIKIASVCEGHFLQSTNPAKLVQREGLVLWSSQDAKKRCSL
jgi:hypothetical protein